MLPNAQLQVPRIYTSTSSISIPLTPYLPSRLLWPSCIQRATAAHDQLLDYWTPMSSLQELEAMSSNRQISSLQSGVPPMRRPSVAQALPPASHNNPAYIVHISSDRIWRAKSVEGYAWIFTPEPETIELSTIHSMLVVADKLPMEFLFCFFRIYAHLLVPITFTRPDVAFLCLHLYIQSSGLPRRTRPALIYQSTVSPASSPLYIHTLRW
jgi:hypothetical protein